MGINVTKDKKVSVDSSHERLVITGHERNPTQTKIRDTTMQASFVFQRVMSKDRSRTNDGNPLIYAFKGLQGYTITTNEVCKLISEFRLILKKILADTHYDLILPMPSKHKISYILANRVVKHQRHGEVINSLLRKKTNGEVLAELRSLHSSTKHSDELIALRKKLEREVPAHPFSMKDVAKPLRHMIHPLTNNHAPARQYKNILLVDDLMSSGSTIKCAYNVVKTVCPDAKVDALCLFSPFR